MVAINILTYEDLYRSVLIGYCQFAPVYIFPHRYFYKIVAWRNTGNSATNHCGVAGLYHMYGLT